MYMAHAATKRAEFNAKLEGQRRADIAKHSADGGAARRIVPPRELEDLIKGYITRGEAPPVAEWVKTYNRSRTWLYDLIKELRSRQK